MSSANFKNYPPGDVADNADVNVPAMIRSLSPGSWVRDIFSGGFGVVVNNNLKDPNSLKLRWATGLESEESGVGIEPSTALAYYEQIKDFALYMVHMSEEAFESLHLSMWSVGEGDLSMEVLSKLEAVVLEMVPDDQGNDDTTDSVWPSIEQAAAEIDAEQSEEDDDIFAAFEVEIEDPKDATQQPTTSASEDGTSAASAENAISPKSHEDAQSATDGDGASSVELGSGTDKGPKSTRSRARSRASKSDAVTPTESAGTGEVESTLCENSDPKPDASTTAGSALTQSEPTADNVAQTADRVSSNTGATDPKTNAADAEAPATGDTVDGATTATMTSEKRGVLTEAGLIDPETGENLDPSLIMRKFGWTELPVLSANASRADVEAFEAKLDQVLDCVEGHLEKAARYRAACELRCKPYDGAAAFWHEALIVPMARQLGPHKLQRDKKGNYKGKTMALPSGAIKFTQTGGWSVHDKALVQDHIQEQGLDKFKEIGAKSEITYNYQKLVAALNKGVLKDLPGTVKREKNPFAKVEIVSPTRANATEGEEDNE